MATVNKDGTIIHEDGEQRRGVNDHVSAVKNELDENSPEVAAKFLNANKENIKKLFGNLPAGWKYTDDYEGSAYEYINGRKHPKNAAIKEGHVVLILKEGNYRGLRAVVSRVLSFEKGKVRVRILDQGNWAGDKVILENFNEYNILSAAAQIDPDDYLIRTTKK
jgi:hypothetical protein